MTKRIFDENALSYQTKFAAWRIYEDLMASGYIDLTKEHKGHSSDLSLNATLNFLRKGTRFQNDYELHEAGRRTRQRDDPMDN
ncbi:hypothetical protein QYF36_010687 [Acer negundo]|nr:hypothetical protein QYF36_010687 [Acer negundo]